MREKKMRKKKKEEKEARKRFRSDHVCIDVFTVMSYGPVLHSTGYTGPVFHLIKLFMPQKYIHTNKFMNDIELFLSGCQG